MNACGSNLFQLAVAIAPGVSINARVVPAMDARIVPRIVWGRVNLYSALSFAEIEPDWIASLELSIAFGSKSPSTARLSFVDVVVVEYDVLLIGL